MIDVAALFVETDGVYFELEDVETWDKCWDARLYSGSNPIVAHPPCQLWGKFAKVNYIRWGGSHNKPGNDGGCFKSALWNLKRCGGVLEHPAFSYAWEVFDLPKPSGIGWINQNGFWICEVWQSAYGHKARKRTWLLYVGKNPPFELRWERKDGSHQIGGYDRRGKNKNKPTISGKEASRTPIEFRDELIKLARNSRMTHPKNTGD